MKINSFIPVKRLGWKGRAHSFVSVFGILWTFAEPFQFFGIGTEAAMNLGIRGYGLLSHLLLAIEQA